MKKANARIIHTLSETFNFRIILTKLEQKYKNKL